MATLAPSDAVVPSDGRRPVRARGGYAKGRATREEILDSAMQLFGEVGYRTASLREVSARVGISHPGLLHHFPSKAALLEAVLVRRDEVDGAAFQADLAAGVGLLRRPRPPRRAQRRPARDRRALRHASAEATSPEHPAHGYFQDRYRRIVADDDDGGSSGGVTRAGCARASTRRPPPGSSWP